MLVRPGAVVRDAGWAVEVKWDGARACVAIGRGVVQVRSRHRTDLTARLPELGALGEDLAARSVVLDGELVVLDERDGHPDFERLRRRLPLTPARAARGAVRDPVRLVAFDVLCLDGEDLRDRSYDERRAVLDQLGLSEPALVPESFCSASHDLAAATARLGLEGVVYKRRASRYRAGRRSADWIKVKHRRLSRLEVTAWQPGGDGQPEELLLAARQRDGRRRHVGRVQFGLDRDRRRVLARALAAYELPRRGRRGAVRDVAPGIEVDVAHHGDRGVLRDPVIRDVIIAER